MGSARKTVHAGARSLRVAFFLFVFFLFFLIVLFVFFFVWLFSNEDIGSYRAIRRVWVEEFWTYSAHAQWYASYPLATAV